MGFRNLFTSKPPDPVWRSRLGIVRPQNGGDSVFLDAIDSHFGGRSKRTGQNSALREQLDKVISERLAERHTLADGRVQTGFAHVMVAGNDQYVVEKGGAGPRRYKPLEMRNKGEVRLHILLQSHLRSIGKHVDTNGADSVTPDDLAAHSFTTRDSSGTVAAGQSPFWKRPFKRTRVAPSSENFHVEELAPLLPQRNAFPHYSKDMRGSCDQPPPGTSSDQAPQLREVHSGQTTAGARTPVLDRASTAIAPADSRSDTHSYAVSGRVPAAAQPATGRTDKQGNTVHNPSESVPSAAPASVPAAHKSNTTSVPSNSEAIPTSVATFYGVKLQPRKREIYPNEVLTKDQKQHPRYRPQFRFHSVKDKNGRLCDNGLFCNFWKGEPTEIGDDLWPTVEHYFQAQKFAAKDTDNQVTLDLKAAIRKQIRDATTPERTKAIPSERCPGRNRQPGPGQVSVDWAEWDTRRVSVMYEAVLAKFSNDPVLQAALLHTNGAVLVEEMPRNRFDDFWGVVMTDNPRRDDAKGQNMLGRILMAVREELQTAGPFDRAAALRNSWSGGEW